VDLSIERLRDEEQAAAETCARMMSETEPWITLGRKYPECLDVVRDRFAETYVARLGGQVVGFVVLMMHGALPGYIRSVCVRADQRGGGIGKALMHFAEDRIFSERPNVFLCVSSFNTGAQRLYLQLGYKQVGELADYLVTGHSELLMRKTRGPHARTARVR